jgi:hypothetical protein
MAPLNHVRLRPLLAIFNTCSSLTNAAKQHPAAEVISFCASFGGISSQRV